MNKNPDILMEMSEALAHEGKDISHLIRFAEIIPHIADTSRIETCVAEFHNQAGRYPYWQDQDIGALILECVADSLADSPLKEYLYKHAQYRAEWCASSATAGGEGLARLGHVRQIEEKRKANHAVDPIP
jgi:hypothetical protein